MCFIALQSNFSQSNIMRIALYAVVKHASKVGARAQVCLCEAPPVATAILRTRFSFGFLLYKVKTVLYAPMLLRKLFNDNSYTLVLPKIARLI